MFSFKIIWKTRRCASRKKYQSLTESLSDNLKSRDASASKKESLSEARNTFPWSGIRLKEKRLHWLSDFSHQEERRVITSVWHLWRASLITLIDGLPCTNYFTQLFLITAITIIKAGSIMTGNHCIDEGDDNQSLIIRHICRIWSH